MLRTGPLVLHHVYMNVLCFSSSSPRLARVTLDNCLPCTAALLQGFEGFPSQAETLFSLGFTCSQQAGRQAGRLSRGGKFVSSGNTVFSLSLALGDKQGCWNWCKTRCYFFDVFFCLCFARSLVLNCSFGKPELLTCTQSGDSLHVFWGVFFGKLDLSASQGCSIPHTSVRQALARTASSNDWRAKQTLTLQEKHTEHFVSFQWLLTYGDVM